MMSLELDLTFCSRCATQYVLESARSSQDMIGISIIYWVDMLQEAEKSRHDQQIIDQANSFASAKHTESP